MKALGTLKKNACDFARGIKIIAGLFGKGDNDKLTHMSQMVEGLIPLHGKDVVRKQVIKAIEDDFKRDYKKGDEFVEKRIQTALACPAYMKLLSRLNMDEYNVRALAVMVKRDMEAKRK